MGWEMGESSYSFQVLSLGNYVMTFPTETDLKVPEPQFSRALFFDIRWFAFNKA
jgi:hypothetical protein